MPREIVVEPLGPGESHEAEGWSVLRGEDSVTVAAPDGTRVRVELAPRPGGPSSANRVLVLGGARSGKSAYAESRLEAAPAVTYVATALPRPDDPEWAARVAAHRLRRPVTWTTVETTDVAGVLRAAEAPVLVDCVSLWLGAHLDDPALDELADELLAAWAARRLPVIAVSSEVGSGVVPVSAAGRRYRDELGRLNARLAATADEVWLLTAGLPRRLR
jgi:adenosylcobinamide kinase/adenosylcobinamide-phosphate guanylyltransferase